MPSANLVVVVAQQAGNDRGAAALSGRRPARSRRTDEGAVRAQPGARDAAMLRSSPVELNCAAGWYRMFAEPILCDRVRSYVHILRNDRFTTAGEI